MSVYAVVSFGRGPRFWTRSLSGAVSRAREEIEDMGGAWAGTTRVVECSSRRQAREADISMPLPVVAVL